MKLFGLLRGLLVAVLLPVNPASGAGEEQDDRDRQPLAVAFEKILETVATKILFDFLKEGFAAVRGKRQDLPQNEVTGNI